MGIRMQNIANLFADTKTRTIVVVTSIVFIVGISVAFIGLRSPSTNEEESAAASAPGGISSVPGAGETSRYYQQLQTRQNLEKAETAQKTGTSAIPTLVGGFEKVPAAKKSGVKTLDEAGGQQKGQRRTPSQQTIVRVSEDTKAQEELEKAMANEAKKLFAAWSGVTKQQMVAGKEPEKRSNRSGRGDGSGRDSDGSSSSSSTDDTGKPEDEVVIKAGDVLYGVLRTSINSDEPGPVMAAVVSGKFKGAKLLGKLQLTQAQTSVILTFNVMNIPGSDESININAVAIDPESARTALADHVNRHYFMRYGALFAASFLEGYANAIQTSGSNSTTSAFGSQTNSYRELSSSEEYQVALGQVGQKWSRAIKDVYKTPYTVTVNSGSGVALLFMSDVKLPVGTEIGSDEFSSSPPGPVCCR